MPQRCGRGSMSKKNSSIAIIDGDSPVQAAARKMKDLNCGGLVVQDNQGLLVGIITERDVLNRVIAHSLDPAEVPVRQVMTARVVSCPVGTDFGQIGRIMVRHRIRHLPVLDERGAVVTIVSSRDIMARQVLDCKAMRLAAEEVAKLSTCLKSLDMDEVTNMVTREVPRLFRASRSVLWISPDEASPILGGAVRRNHCQCDPKGLASRPMPSCGTGPHGLLASRPACCHPKAGGGRGDCIMIPLSANRGHKNGKDAGCGYLCLCGLKRPDESSSDLLWYKASLVREILSAYLRNSGLYEQAKHDSLTDSLTGVGTRRLWEDRLGAECSRANRYGRPFSAAIVDVDHFKLVNDRLGHIAGDHVLRELGALMTRIKRSSDVLARYGGDEFVLLMPETTTRGASAMLERIRHDAQTLPLPGHMKVSVSCGLTQKLAGEKVTPGELIHRADMALYAAKNAGRNRVQLWNATMSLAAGGAQNRAHVA